MRILMIEQSDTQAIVSIVHMQDIYMYVSLSQTTALRKASLCQGIAAEQPAFAFPPAPFYRSPSNVNSHSSPSVESRKLRDSAMYPAQSMLFTQLDVCRLSGRWTVPSELLHRDVANWLANATTLVEQAVVHDADTQYADHHSSIEDI